MAKIITGRLKDKSRNPDNKPLNQRPGNKSTLPGLFRPIFI